MVFYRALQGFTGGVMIPISFTVANTMLPPGTGPLGLALFGVTATRGPASALCASGLRAPLEGPDCSGAPAHTAPRAVPAS